MKWKIDTDSRKLQVWFNDAEWAKLKRDAKKDGSELEDYLVYNLAPPALESLVEAIQSGPDTQKVQIAFERIR